MDKQLYWRTTDMVFELKCCFLCMCVCIINGQINTGNTWFQLHVDVSIARLR